MSGYLVGHTIALSIGIHPVEIANTLKSALVKRSVVSPDRLTTAGAGASTPVATNKTLEGRALNTCVELLRTDR